MIFSHSNLPTVTGEILYKWPKVGQLRKIPREEIPPGVEIVQFFGMRDLQGKEQYSYLIEPQHGEQKHGIYYIYTLSLIIC